MRRPAFVIVYYCRMYYCIVALLYYCTLLFYCIIALLYYAIAIRCCIILLYYAILNVSGAPTMPFRNEVA